MFYNDLACRFKLCLADTQCSSSGQLPEGFTAHKVISDYLRFLGKFALDKLYKQWGSEQITSSEVMWAVAVPAAWSDMAKDTMRQAAVTAGLVRNSATKYVCLAGVHTSS